MPSSAPTIWSTSALAWESLVPGWVLILLALGGSALLGFQFVKILHRVGRKDSALLIGMRTLALALFFGLLLGPVLLIQERERLVPAVAVLVDNSRSMGLKDGNPSATRLDLARQALGNSQAGLLHELQGRFTPQLYLFNEDLQRVSAKDLAQARAEGSATRIQKALAQVTDQSREEQAPLAGVLLLSDGAQTDGAPPQAPRGVPIVAIPVGNPQKFRDLSVSSLNVPPLGFVNIPLDLKFSVRNHGYPELSVPLILRRGDRILQSKTVTVPAEGEAQVSFRLTPKEVGDHQLSASTPLRAEEEIAGNNQVQLTVRVLRDRIRALIVSGSPSWNYRFLREALKSDPTLDLVSFVILRTPLDEVNVPENELSLIPFPTDRLFTQELDNFDLIVFDNFTYLPYFPFHYLENIKKFVEKGGAFAMLGGPSSFRDGGYAGTPIEEILPVRMGDSQATYQKNSISVQLTREGTNHPMTRFGSNGHSPAEVWNQLPRLDGYNRVDRLKSGAILLATGRGLGGEGNAEPVLVVGSYGKGRTMALMSDYFWRWNFTAAGGDQSNRPYLQFVHRMVRWLIRDPGLDPLVAKADRAVYEPGEEVTIRIRALDRDYSPAKNPTLSVSLQGPGGENVSLIPKPGEKAGDFIATWRPGNSGEYRVRVETRGQPENPGRSEFSFRVQSGTLEAASGFPNRETLQSLAGSSQGLVVSPEELSRGGIDKIRRLLESRSQFRLLAERRLKLGQTPWAFALLTLVLCAEWFLRRRRGLS